MIIFSNAILMMFRGGRNISNMINSYSNTISTFIIHIIHFYGYVFCEMSCACLLCPLCILCIFDTETRILQSIKHACCIKDYISLSKLSYVSGIVFIISYGIKKININIVYYGGIDVGYLQSLFVSRTVTILRLIYTLIFGMMCFFPTLTMD